MQEFTVVSGTAAPFTAPNIDTDVIMPKQFLKGVDRSGLDRGTFHDLRFDANGEVRADFVLNQDPWRDTCFLIVGSNFGCGSSREHAVWGLGQLGIRALIGTSFAGIFNDNCKNNGLLTISLTPEEVARLAKVADDPDTNEFTIDLPAQVIVASNERIPFEIDALKKDALMRGLDPVSATLQYAEDIRRFEKTHFATNPWFA